MRLRHAWTNRDAEPRASILGRPSLPNPRRQQNLGRVLLFSLTADTLASQADVLVGFAVGLAGPGPIRGRIEARAR